MLSDTCQIARKKALRTWSGPRLIQDCVAAEVTRLHLIGNQWQANRNPAEKIGASLTRLLGVCWAMLNQPCSLGFMPLVDRAPRSRCRRARPDQGRSSDLPLGKAFIIQRPVRSVQKEWICSSLRLCHP